MREWGDAFARQGAVIIGVTFEPPSAIARFVRREHVPFPLLSDPSRQAYAAFGLGRGRAAQIWGRATVLAYLRGILRGRWPRQPHGDVHQLGGDVVLDRCGRVVLVLRSTSPADRPSVQEILAAVGRASRADNPKEGT